MTGWLGLRRREETFGGRASRQGSRRSTRSRRSGRSRRSVRDKRNSQRGKKVLMEMNAKMQVVKVSV